MVGSSEDVIPPNDDEQYKTCNPAQTQAMNAVRLVSSRHLHRAMSSSSLPNNSSLPGEHFEVRQTSSTDDYHPDPSKSLPLSSARQALMDDIIALYSCHPTRRRVERYTPDCVYDDQFVYANDRFKMAGQWFALPKLFRSSKNESYQVVKNDPLLIQFKNEQVRPSSPFALLRCILTSYPRRGPSPVASNPPP